MRAEPVVARQPHAVLDLQSRQWKAVKIERLLGLEARPGPLRLLEVGTGSGGIAHYFGTHPSGRFTVDAVDVKDNRQVVEGYAYQTVDSVQLPFADASFDVVLTNHVIEHVGDAPEQRRHLAEVRRVLRDDGVAYLAVPNRWMLVEPHYRLAFLSWLPRPWRSPYLRWSGKGSEYDCLPLDRPTTERMLAEAGFAFDQEHGRALLLTYELERPRALAYRALFRHVPMAVWRALRSLFPTLIYRLRPTVAAGVDRPA